jgi:hypothetical protein
MTVIIIWIENLKVKLPLCLIKQYAMNTYRGVEGLLHYS